MNSTFDYYFSQPGSRLSHVCMGNAPTSMHVHAPGHTVPGCRDTYGTSGRFTACAWAHPVGPMFQVCMAAHEFFLVMSLNKQDSGSNDAAQSCRRQTWHCEVVGKMSSESDRILSAETSCTLDAMASAE